MMSNMECRAKTGFWLDLNFSTYGKKHENILAVAVVLAVVVTAGVAVTL